MSATPDAAVRRVASWRGITIAMALFALTRLVQLVILRWMSRPDSAPVRDRLLGWDAGWYVRAAMEGYPHALGLQPNGEIDGSTLAFFPVYPALIRLVHLTGLAPATAALVVSAVLGLVAAGFGYLLVADLAGPGPGHRAGLAFAVLVGAQPMSVILSMGYSEATLFAAALGCLYAARRGAWLAAGLAGVLAALTRPTGMAAAIALAVAAGIAIHRGTRPLRPVLASAAALVAAPAFLVWAGLRVGHLDGWFQVEEGGWGTHFDVGRATWTQLVATLRDAGDSLVYPVAAWVLIGTALGVLVALLQRTWPPFLVYGIVVLGLAVGSSGYFHSRPRLVLPVLVGLVPVAIVLGRARPRVAIAVLAVVVLASAWFGAYMLTIWSHAI